MGLYFFNECAMRNGSNAREKEVLNYSEEMPLISAFRYFKMQANMKFIQEIRIIVSLSMFRLAAGIYLKNKKIGTFFVCVRPGGNS